MMSLTAKIVWEIYLENEWLKFLVIAKPLVADGNAKSPKMFLVFNKDGLRKLTPPIVLQEFGKHGGVIFKVYVVGDYVKCVKRKSLPDVKEDNLGRLESYLSFSQDDKEFESLKKVQCEKEVRVLVGSSGCGEDEGTLLVSPLKIEENENPIQVKCEM
ncbi:hypothetical protein P3S67_003480 [Capsicum chacoense]